LKTELIARDLGPRPWLKRRNLQAGNKFQGPSELQSRQCVCDSIFDSWDVKHLYIMVSLMEDVNSGQKKMVIIR